MKYDGVVIKIEELYLFILNPETNKIMDGINISDHECYKDLNDDKLIVVEVSIKDGTQDIEDLDLNEFIYGDTYAPSDTFIYIHDIESFTFTDTDSGGTKNVSILDIIDNGDLNDVAIECIESVKIAQTYEVFKDL